MIPEGHYHDSIQHYVRKIKLFSFTDSFNMTVYTYLGFSPKKPCRLNIFIFSHCCAFVSQQHLPNRVHFAVFINMNKFVTLIGTNRSENGWP